MHDLIADFRFAVRHLSKHPVFALSVLLSLAMGIGVNTTVFSISNAILFRAPQATNADDLVRVYVNHHSPFRWADYQRLKRDRGTFSHVIAETMQPVSLSDAGDSQRAVAAVVSGDYFAALGLTPSAGQFPHIDREEQPSAVPQLVLSHAFWTSRFASDPSVIGRTVQLNGHGFEVRGIAPVGFTTAQVLWTPDVYVPISETVSLLGRGPDVLSGGLYLTARLASGVSRDVANTRVAHLFAEAAREDSARLARQSWRVDAAVGANAEMRGPVTIVSAFLLTIALAVLLVAAFNVGNLVLARNASRARELSVRIALGASRARVIRQLLVELALIASLGAALALVATKFSTALLVRLIPAEAGLKLSTATDGGVLAFTALLVVLVVAVSGFGPALQSTRIDITAALRDGAAGSSARRTRLRRVFLGLQVAVSTMLVACAGLFLHSLRNADRLDAGFDTARILNAPIELGRGRDAASGAAFVAQAQSRVRELPGVVGVAGATVVPLSGNNAETSILLEGDAADARRQTYFVSVTPGYFSTMRMPLARGREFTESDRAGATPVAIVNETMEKQFWPGGTAIGKRLSMNGTEGPWLEIVGVSRAIRYNSLGETPPVFLYVPFQQVGNHDLTLHVVIGEGASVASVSAGIIATVRALDPAIPPPAVRLLTDEQRIVLLPAQLGAGLTGAFGGLALLLAAVGIFGVAAFDVSLRRRELGIRSALGAPASSILRTVLGETFRTVVAGAVIGLALAMVLGRLLSSQLYGVSAIDPVTFLITPLVLVMVAVGATLAPAHRAVSIDPADALRDG